MAKLTKEVSEPSQRVTELYLGTLGREPTKAETEFCITHLNGAASPEKGLQAVLWSLLNTKEFLLQH